MVEKYAITQKNRDISKLFSDKKLDTKTMETIDINFISIFKEGPEVSLYGSPTVSPITLAW